MIYDNLKNLSGFLIVAKTGSYIILIVSPMRRQAYGKVGHQAAAGRAILILFCIRNAHTACTQRDCERIYDNKRQLIRAVVLLLLFAARLLNWLFTKFRTSS